MDHLNIVDLDQPPRDRFDWVGPSRTCHGVRLRAASHGTSA